MSLSGTLGSFALPDVLKLLATTNKTGCLSVETERGRGTLDLVEGKLARCFSPWSGREDEPGIVLFEMLCSDDGTFMFDVEVPASDVEEVSVDIEETLREAESYLDEWREICLVMPPAESQLRLVAERNGEDITLSASQWQAVVALGVSASVKELGDRLGLGELATGRLVRDLVGLDVVSFDIEAHEEPDRASLHLVAPVVDEIVFERPSPAYGIVLPQDSEMPGAIESVKVEETARSLDSWSDDPPALLNYRTFDEIPVTASAPTGLFAGNLSNDLGTTNDGLDGGLGPGLDSQGLEDSTEMARQLANLSPRAAAAVAAAAGSSTEAEHEAVAAQIAEDGDDSANRGLLLKFLSNIKE